MTWSLRDTFRRADLQDEVCIKTRDLSIAGTGPSTFNVQESNLGMSAVLGTVDSGVCWNLEGLQLLRIISDHQNQTPKFPTSSHCMSFSC